MTIVDGNVESLITGFDEHLANFETAVGSGFAGPSLHFHRRTVQRLLSLTLPAVVADPEDPYFDWLYATLAAWGMHRTGTATQLVGFDEFRDSLCCPANADLLLSLVDQSITDLEATDVSDVVDKLWQLVFAMQIGISPHTKIVANSKALHHLLPALVPPIDRRYTLRFFFGSTNIGNQQTQLAAVYEQFVGIAAARAEAITARVDTHEWHTSVTKVIDNAIIGFIQAGGVPA